MIYRNKSNIMKSLTRIMALVGVLFTMLACGGQKYETVKNDPQDTKIYTLDNGLKVYMSVNK